MKTGTATMICPVMVMHGEGWLYKTFAYGCIINWQAIGGAFKTEGRSVL